LASGQRLDLGIQIANDIREVPVALHVYIYINAHQFKVGNEHVFESIDCWRHAHHGSTTYIQFTLRLLLKD